MAEVQAGTLIDGRYKVLSRLGSGGMADVFLAQDGQLGRKVALKLLHGRFAEDPGFVERFRREAQSAAGLQHPNVVSVYDRGAYDGTYYIAMEYLPGRTLKQVIRDDAPLDPIRAIGITIQMLTAARFAHRSGVIHRDLKPQNVIVDDADHAKVTDFGIARAGASDMTETGSIMGTAQYLSPEQAQGYAVSASSDLYSVAVVLYEMLTGRVPFDGEAAVTIALKHVSESPTAPTAINSRIPLDLEQVVMWALNKDPAHRPADADQFIAALEQARSAIVSGATNQHTASMAALGVAALGAGVVAAPAILPEPAQAAGPDLAPYGGAVAAVPVEDRPPPPERSRRWPWFVLVAVLLLAAGGGLAAYLLTRPAQKLVPQVVGGQLDTARTQLQNAGFAVGTINVGNAKPAGIVISEQPAGGARADAGSTVTLTVSQGPGNGTVPSVQGLSLGAAERLIRKAGLKVGRHPTQASGQFPAGQVTRTDPTAGTTPPVGTPVTIFVSSGKAAAAVPDVTGQSRADATATLQAAGFKVAASTQTSSTVTAGNVTSQDPAGGSNAPAGSVVAIVVAGAPTTATVPDVTGDTASAATSALTAAGFQVSRTSKSVVKPSRDGIVLSQSPGAGPAGKGATVAIVVGHYAGTTSTTTTTTDSTTSTTTT
ncbi:MAG: Stk1 family PASTA domain-containing Ser/Thr kinase [Solirubrobacteraceae bacterium]